MFRLALGSLAAAVAMFFWGFFYWGTNIIDPASHVTADGEKVIADAIRTHVPHHGLYFLPDRNNGSPADVAARASQGPFVMMHVKPAGANIAGDPVVMVMGFLHMLVSCFLLGLILTWALPALPTWLDRFKLGALIGFTAAFFAHAGSFVWWYHALAPSLLFAAYDFVAYLIASAILAWFVRPG